MRQPLFLVLGTQQRAKQSGSRPRGAGALWGGDAKQARLPMTDKGMAHRGKVCEGPGFRWLWRVW